MDNSVIKKELLLMEYLAEPLIIFSSQFYAIIIISLNKNWWLKWLRFSILNTDNKLLKKGKQTTNLVLKSVFSPLNHATFFKNEN